MSIGLDPEFFVVDGGHHIVPASKFLESPETDVAYDNAAVEIRPLHSSCIQGFMSNVRETFHHAVMKMRLARMRGEIPSTSHISFAPAARLREGDMALPSVQQFGCSPSLIVEPDGGLAQTTAQVDPLSFAYRSAGYHVHVGYGGTQYVPTEEVPTKATMLADIFVGLVDVMMVHRASQSWVKGSRIRRSIMGYGRAGEHRVRQVGRTSYGYGTRVWEYRTLSPWPMAHPLWSWWAQSAVRQCYRALQWEDPFDWGKLPNRSEVIDVINECDGKGAQQLWLAALEATGGGLPGGDGNDAVTARNNRKLAYALARQGYETFMGGWTPEQAWFRNTMDTDKSLSPRRSLRQFIYGSQGGRTYISMNRSSSPKHFNLQGFTRHEKGRITTFPSGTDNYFRLIEDRTPTFLDPKEALNA